MDSSQKDYTINTKSAVFSRKQVRIMAFLYATPATQNNSLITTAAIPGIPQNRKCCFIYNKLLGMIKQSMPTGWVGALCTAPNEPAFPERQFLIKVNTVLCLIKVNKYFPKSHIASSSFATFPFFPPFSSFNINITVGLLKSTEYRGQKYVAEMDTPNGGGGGGSGVCLHFMCFSTIHS